MKKLLSNLIKFMKVCQKIIEVLFDDRKEISAGEKFADADLLGMPYRLVVSPRSMKENGIEVKKEMKKKGKLFL